MIKEVDLASERELLHSNNIKLMWLMNACNHRSTACNLP